MKKTLLLLIVCCFSGNLAAQQPDRPNNRPDSFQPKITKWVRFAPRLSDDFFTTDEARRIGDNLLLYQHNSGGWPKNINMQDELTDSEKEWLIIEKDNVDESTIDNDATTTEMIYLARLYKATQDEKYKDAVFRGIDYLLEAQYDNGGWPQFYPRATGYYTQITYNDNAMINVMKVLRNVFEHRSPFEFVPDTTCAKLRAAFDKGIDCILKTQIKRNGKPTVWCAQHDKETLLPCEARSYELPSFSGAESFNILLFLMSLPQPSDSVKQAIEAGVAWTREAGVENLRFEFYVNEDGERDYRMVYDENAPTLWARFYDLETGKPIFVDRTGIKYEHVEDISQERRIGYSWYGTGGSEVLKAYEEWKERQ